MNKHIIRCLIGITILMGAVVVFFRYYPNNKEENKAESQDVVCMYLTVTPGEEQHTWEEINQYSVYDYQDMGVDKYTVDGLLQVGDETGVTLGDYGYGMDFANATVSIRGQASSTAEKKSYKIKLKDKMPKWNEQKVINLNKYETDGIRFTDSMSYKLMEDAGMIAMRTQFVHLYVKDLTQETDGEYVDYGLYTHIEQPNKRFLINHGLDKEGNLYKTKFFEFYRYEDTIKLESDPTYDKTEFEIYLKSMTGEDHSKLISMLADANNEEISTKDVLEHWFDEDNLYTWMAFHMLIGNVDVQSRNTLLYSPSKEDTFYFISWDNDGAFRHTLYSFQGIDSYSGWEKGISNYWGTKIYNRVLMDNTCRAKFCKKVEEVKAILTKEKIASYIAEYRKITEQYRHQEPDCYVQAVDDTQYNILCETIPDEVEWNYQKYLESLEQPMPFFIGEIEGNTKDGTICWGKAYDFDNELITYHIEVAKDKDIQQVIVDMDQIEETECKIKELPPGEYFLRIQAQNESGYTQTAFDYYVENDVKYYGEKHFQVDAEGNMTEIY